MLAEMTGANEKYKTKRYTNVNIAFIIQKGIRMCLVSGNIFENVGFLKETRRNLPFIEKYNIFECFHVPDTFLWLLNYERYVHVCESFRHKNQSDFCFCHILIDSVFWGLYGWFCFIGYLNYLAKNDLLFFQFWLCNFCCRKNVPNLVVFISIIV